MNPNAIHKIIPHLKKKIREWPVPVVGHYTQTPFKVLMSTLLSLRTQDKTTDAASARLFALAQTPAVMEKLSAAKIEKAIYPVSFYRVKARNILKICRILLEQYKGQVPNDIDALVELPGVGRKTANLVVTLGFGQLGICVDTHVHRIANRWGYVKTSTPDKTETALRKKLPKQYWIILNDLLVAYGQNLCKPLSPFCSRCVIHRYCDRVGVTKQR